MSRKLIVTSGARQRELLLVGVIVVGRDPVCDVSEDGDTLLSRRHAEFVTSTDGVMVRDLGSRNGTYVNGVKIAESPLDPGDVVQIGHLELRYVDGDRGLPSPVRLDSPADEEATRVMQAVRPSTARPASAPVALASNELDDATRVLPRAAARGSMMPAAADPDDDQTVVIMRPPGPGTPPPASTPAAAVIPTAGAVAPSVREAPTPEASRHQDALASFVFTQAALLAACVFLATALPQVIGLGPVVALGAGLFACVAGVAVIGRAMASRAGAALASAHEEVSRKAGRPA